MKTPCQFVAAHDRHHHVNDKEVKPRLGCDKPKRVWSIARGYDLVATAHQHPFGELADPFVIINDQNAAGYRLCH